MNITFWGASRQVTGSMYQVSLANGYNILVDCGLDYEDRSNFYDNNRNFPFLPEELNLVILTHAHIDHSGNLPNLVRQGYSGPILCTAATAELTGNLLADSLQVQRIEGNKKLNIRKRGHKNRRKIRQHPDVPTLYDKVHIDRTCEMMQTAEFNKTIQINDDVSVRFVEAGHILGAASVHLSLKENGRTVQLGFTGDLGNYDSVLVKNPAAMSGLDYLVSESTYGGRKHSHSGIPEDILLQYVQDTCVKFNGKLVIPAFSVGRTQAIIYTLCKLYHEGRLPQVKIYTDSPLAIRTTRMYAAHINDLNDEAIEFYLKNGELFSFPDLYTIENDTDSKMISLSPEPAVIISAAGMVEGGRIKDHIRNNIGDPYSTILIAGYCAEGTLGAELLKGKPSVEINKRPKQVYAKVFRTDVFSAHPDSDGLIRYFRESEAEKMRKVFLVHGEAASMEALKQESGLPNIEMPEQGDVYEL